MTSEVNVVITPQEVAVAVSPQTITIEIADPAKIGPTGATGKSAYEIAVDNGFIGTEEEWLLTITGPQGEVGPQGATGSQGIQGIQGVKGDTGLQGPKGDTGDAGVQGIQGVQGLKGDTGATGPQGTNGTDGDDGLSAYQVAVANGFIGTEPQWLESLVGPTGATGPSGTNGIDGKTVRNGSGTPSSGLGVDGDFYIDVSANTIYGPKTTGAWGTSTSLVGPTGATGPAGATGDTGATGPQGIQGVQGPQGDLGPAGADGAPGADGAQGDPGPAGADGASAYEVAVANGFVGNEAAWLAGLVGPTGATGATGAQGTAATIAVGTVTTGAAGSAASITNVGTSSAAIFDFTIPRGDTGAGGGGAVTISGKTGAYTVVAGDLGTVINCTANTFTVSLTAAATLGAGFHCWVWNTSNTSSHAITINPDGSETIDGATTLLIRRGEGFEILCDGTSWQTAGTKKQRLYSENAANNATRPVVSGSNACAFGVSSQATATSSVAFGDGAIASGTSAVAIGTSRATTQDSVAIAITNNTTTYGAKTNTSAIAIGWLNISSGLGTTTAGGGGNTATLDYASVLGGYGNNATGVYSTVVGGTGSTASGSYSGVVSGFINLASGSYSAVIGGARGVASVAGKVAFPPVSNEAGAHQSCKMTLFGSTSSATPLTLKSDTSAAGATNQLVLSNYSSMAVTGRVIAQRKGSESTTSTAMWTFNAVIRRGANAASTALVAAVTPTLIAADADAAAWTIAVSADTTNGTLAVTATGEAGKNIRWVCTLESTETIYT